MKKKIFAAIFAAMLCLVFTFGCSSGKPVLSFNNAFVSGKDVGKPESDPPAGYYETLTYEVLSNEKDYTYKRDSAKNDSALSADSFKYEIKGTYTSALKVLGALPSEVAASANTDITISGKVYHLVTELKLNASYTAGGAEEFTHADSVRSEIYFLPYGEAFAPIYSVTESDYTMITGGDKSVTISVVKSYAEVKYFASAYEISSRAVQYAAGEEEKKLEDETLAVSRHDYSYKTITDNAELLFAIRNMKIDAEGTFNVPVVTAAYKEATDLTVKNLQEFDDDAAFTYNGAAFNGKMKVKELAYYVNSQNNTGSRQLVYVQKNETENAEASSVPNHSLTVKMVSPITVYGSFSRLGSLVYKLTEAVSGNAL